MSENQASINEWIEETFGPAGTNFSVLARANKEMAELIFAVSTGENPQVIAEECADVVICLYRVAERTGEDLEDLSDHFEYTPNSSELTLAPFAGQKLMRLILVCAMEGDHVIERCFLGEVYRLINHICFLIGHDLKAEIDRKMEINRKQDRAGHGEHVKKSFTCKARKQGSDGGNTPPDCDWPFCDCDSYADKVIAAIEESGLSIVKVE